MTEVYVNSIIGYRDPSDDMRVCDKYRVLWIVADNRQVVIINLSGKTMPEVRDLSDLQEEFTSGLTLKLTDDPFSKLVNPSEEFLAKHKHIRDRAWDIIKRTFRACQPAPNWKLNLAYESVERAGLQSITGRMKTRSMS